MVEGVTFWDDISEKGMILLDLRLLTGLVGITEEKAGLALPSSIVFNGADIGKFPTVIGERQWNNISENKASVG